MDMRNHLNGVAGEYRGIEGCQGTGYRSTNGEGLNNVGGDGVEIKPDQKKGVFVIACTEKRNYITDSGRTSGECLLNML